jgi:nucleotide-binding universal stress UspA family protein
MFKKILACSDLTAGSAAAIKGALALSPLHQASICAIHVVPLPSQIRRWAAPVFKNDQKVYYELLARQMEQAQQELERQVRRLAGGAAPGGLLVRIGAGDAASVIAAAADELQADLIIVARGRRGILGRVAEQVVRMTGRTVLVVPGKSKTSAAQRAPLPEEKRPRRTAGARARSPQ